MASCMSALGINRSRSAYYYCICTLQRHIPARVTTITTSGDYLGEELLWLCGVVESYKAEYTFESRAGAKISGNTIAQRTTMQGLFRLTTVTSWIHTTLAVRPPSLSAKLLWPYCSVQRKASEGAV